MRIIDQNVTLELDDTDPRAVFIRELLKDRAAPPDENALTRFWEACNESQRRLLLLVARTGEATQASLAGELPMEELHVHNVAISLARVGRRTGMHSPLGITGSAKAGRRYFLDEQSAAHIRHLAERGVEKAPRPRRLAPRDLARQPRR